MKIRTALIITIIISATASSCLSVILGQKSYEHIVTRIKQLKKDSEISVAQGRLDSFIHGMSSYLLNINSDQDLASKYILSIESKINTPLFTKVSKIKKDTGAGAVRFYPAKKSKTNDCGSKQLGFAANLNYYGEKIAYICLLFDQKDLRQALDSDLFFTDKQPGAALLKHKGILPVYYSTQDLDGDSVNVSVFLTLFLLVFVSLLIALSCFAIIAKKLFTDNVVRLAQILGLQSKAALNYQGLLKDLQTIDIQISELNELRDGLVDFVGRLDSADKEIKNSQQRELTLQAQQVKFNLARQLAHDIRSPVAALAMIQKSLSKEIPPQANDIIVQVTSRLRSLSEKMLNETRKSPFPCERVSLRSVLQRVIDEKNIEYMDIGGLRIRCRSLGTLNKDFVDFPNTELFSIFSNIFNNSIEAAFAAGRSPRINVIIAQNLKSNELEVHISDNGGGIPADIIQRIGNEDLSFGKSNGNGIALRAAKESLARSSSRMKFTSWMGSGSRVTLSFPKLKVLEVTNSHEITI